MDLPLYKQLRQIIQSYDYNDQSGFKPLYKYARDRGLHGLTLRQFVTHAKNMGVSSHVKRIDSGLVRYLAYDQRADKYRTKIMPLLDTCPNCKGLGVVKIKLS